MNLRKKWKKGYKAAIPMLAILAAGMMMNMPVQAAEITVEEAEIPAPETAVTSGSCGTNVTWSYDSTAKKLTISGTGAMTDYAALNSIPWYSERANIKSVVVGSGVTSIGDGAFSGCSNLSSIELPAGITRIGGTAFTSCSNLSSIDLPDGIMSIGGGAFAYCSNLSSIDLPDGITSIESLTFSGCSSLSSIDLPDGITSIGGMAFNNCSELSSIELPAGITSIEDYAFLGCNNLNKVITACSWKSTPLYSFDSNVSQEYNHTGNITVQSDDTQDTIRIYCSTCSENFGVIKLKAPTNRKYTGGPIVAGATSTSTLYTPNVTYAGANLVNGKPQNAGTYTAIMKVNTPQGEKTVSLEYEIEKAASTCTKAPTAKNLTYTGQSQTLLNAGTASGGTLQYSLSQSGTYSTTIPQKTDVGSYTVYYKVVGDGNHTDTTAKSVSVTIGKAAGSIGGDDTYTKTYGDTAFTLNATANHNESALQYAITTGSDVVSLSGNNISILKAGSATIKVSLSGSANYNAAEKEIAINVQKKFGYTTEEINKSYLYLRENTDSVDLASLVPADSGTVNYAVPQTEGDVTYSVAPAIENGILSYTVNAGEVDAQGTVKVTVSSDNYEDFDIILNVKLHDQTPVKVQDDMSVALLNDTLTYGETWSVLEFAQNIFTDEEGNVIEGSLEWKCPDEVPVAGTSYGTWVFTPDDPEYATLEGTVSVTVNKVVPTVTEMPVIAERIYHPMEVPADSELTGGNVSVPGSWSFGEATVLPAGIHTCEVIFTPEDTDNYETVTGTVEVTVTKAAPFIKTMPEASPITYGETLADSTLTDGVVWYSETEELPVGGSFAWEDGDIRPTVAESLTPIYTLIFTPSDSDNYHSVEIISGVQVNKAQDAPDMPADTMSVPFGIRLVDEVTLPENWVWQTEDGKKALKPENPLTVTAVYVGEDKDNYENVTVQITITRTSKEWMFTDVAVKPGHWKYENIKYVYDNEIMNGINGTTQFQPDESLNRAMFATVLYRMAGSPQVTYESVFPDVEEGRYYSEAIVWAKRQGMVTGYGDGTYGVNRNITREQIAKILYEYAAGCGYDVSGSASLESFTDGDQVGDWAEGYIRWAVHTGMIEGKPNDDGTYRIDPKGDATRAECAKMLRYFMVTYQ